MGRPCGRGDLEKQRPCHGAVLDMRVSVVFGPEDRSDVKGAGESNADEAGCLLGTVPASELGIPVVEGEVEEEVCCTRWFRFGSGMDLAIQLPAVSPEPDHHAIAQTAVLGHGVR